MVRKYGKEKNDICAENVSSIVEYVSGIQTFRAYGVGGMKNKTVINAMREFCRISFVYEAKVLPIGAGFGIFKLAVLSTGYLVVLCTLDRRDTEYCRLPFDLYVTPVLCKVG